MLLAAAARDRTRDLCVSRETVVRRATQLHVHAAGIVEAAHFDPTVAAAELAEREAGAGERGFEALDRADAGDRETGALVASVVREEHLHRVDIGELLGGARDLGIGEVERDRDFAAAARQRERGQNESV
jgi:hypothetical protein